MTGVAPQIDHLAAAALRGEVASWPEAWSGAAMLDAIRARLLYHGIAGLLADRSAAIADWPTAVTAPLRQQALAQGMWEIRHRQLLIPLLAALDRAGVEALLLKGSALAYDLYPAPAARSRGDSDILVAPGDLDRARVTLRHLGYRRDALDPSLSDDLALQEMWSIVDADGTRHAIDLHWQLLNTPALAGVLPVALCTHDPLPLPRLTPAARSMSRVATLLHTCVHRALHLTSPYFVNGVTHYGGDRLIWAQDIDLLAGALSDSEWRQFAALAVDQGVADVCHNGLDFARVHLGTKIPGEVNANLAAAGRQPASDYLLGRGQFRRAWCDWRSISGGSRKLAYVRARILPPAAFIRAKYPRHAGQPLALLYLKRMVDLVRSRRDAGQ